MTATLIFPQGQTREGMKWAIKDVKTGLPVNLLGATVNLSVYDAVDRETIIIEDICEIVLPPEDGVCIYNTKVGDMDRVGRYEVELNPIEFGDGSIGILDNMQIVIKDVGPGN